MFTLCSGLVVPMNHRELRCLVCGGRDFGVIPAGCPTDRHHERRVRAHEESRLLDDTLATLKVDRGIKSIIQGGARGADRLAFIWAGRQLIQTETFLADWKTHGKAAGPIRNQRMIDEGKPDLVVAFPGGKGTADMVRRAKAAGIEVIEVPLPPQKQGDRR
jgi:hypothetical protein